MIVVPVFFDSSYPCPKLLCVIGKMESRNLFFRMDRRYSTDIGSLISSPFVLILYHLIYIVLYLYKIILFI
jgi:hypothetical protein